MTPEERNTFVQTPTSINVQRLKLIVPSDTVDLPYKSIGLWVGKNGSIKFLPVNNPDNEPVTMDDIWNVYLPIEVRRVFATGTTATVYAWVA